MKLFKNRCYNGGTKHNFQPRYSEKDRSDITKLKGQFEDSEEARRFITLKIYVCDICEWCGERIKNE